MNEITELVAPSANPTSPAVSINSNDVSGFVKFLGLFGSDIRRAGGPDQWFRSQLGVNLHSFLEIRREILKQHWFARIEGFVSQLKNLEATNRVTTENIENALTHPINDSCDTYTKEEALSTLRAMCLRQALTPRQFGVISDLLPLRMEK